MANSAVGWDFDAVHFHGADDVSEPDALGFSDVVLGANGCGGWSKHNGFFADSRIQVLEIGIESVTWNGPATWTSSRTFPSPAGKPDFRFESRRWYGSNLVGLGFWKTDYVDWQPAYRNHQLMVRMPWWFLWVLTLGVAAIYYLRWRMVTLRAKRLRDGLCIRCGYDLGASPGRCPECGRDANTNAATVVAVK